MLKHPNTLPFLGRQARQWRYGRRLGSPPFESAEDGASLYWQALSWVKTVVSQWATWQVHAEGLPRHRRLGRRSGARSGVQLSNAFTMIGEALSESGRLRGTPKGSGLLLAW